MEKNSLKNTNFRTKVVNLLTNIFYKNMLLNNDLFNEKDQDIRQIKRVVFGVVENKIWLTNIISTYSKTPIKKLDEVVYVSLLSGIYEILSMKGMPSYATINEYVNIVKKKRNRLAGFVNAILREVDRNGECIKSKWETLPPYIQYSVPEIIYKEYEKYDILLKRFYDGCALDDTSLKVDSVFNRPRYDYIRIDSFDKKIVNDILEEFDRLNIKYKKYDGDLDFKKFDVYIVNDLQKVINSDSFKKGLIYIEDVSSIYAIEKVYETFINNIDDKNVSYMDACSSPGGKVLGLAAALEDRYGRETLDIIALDKTKEKVDKIKENIAYRKKYIKVDQQEANVYNDKYKEKYNIVWADVPCSGLGVISRKPDIAYNYDPKEEKNLVDIQKNILDNVKKYLSKGGILTYSTCTILEEENEYNVKDFLDKNNNFKLLYEKRFLPYDISLKSDGFYIAIMKREN